MNTAAELLAAATARDGAKLDEKLNPEVFRIEPSRSRQQKEGR
jgi:hypothetical protein